MLRALALFLLAGAVVPLVWFLSRWLIPSFGHWWLIDAPGWMDSLLLLLWPGSLILLGDVEGRSLLFPVLSIGLNILMYGLIGLIFNLGRALGSVRVS